MNLNYTIGIPATPDNPSDDQPDMKINNDSTEAIIRQDHFGYNDNKGGTHKQVRLTNQSAPGFAAADGVLYSSSINSRSYPIWQNTDGSTILLSSPTLNTLRGYASLPGQMLIQWGTDSTIGTTTPISFPKSFSSNAFSVVATSQTVTVFLDVESLLSNQFTVRRSGLIDTPFCWIAIGKN